MMAVLTRACFGFFSFFLALSLYEGTLNHSAYYSYINSSSAFGAVSQSGGSYYDNDNNGGGNFSTKASTTTPGSPSTAGGATISSSSSVGGNSNKDNSNSSNDTNNSSILISSINNTTTISSINNATTSSISSSSRSSSIITPRLYKRPPNVPMKGEKYNPQWLVVSKVHHFAMTFVPKVMCTSIRDELNYANCIAVAAGDGNVPTSNSSSSGAVPVNRRCAEARKNRPLNQIPLANYTTAIMIR
jgi:hypothetical protein